jgi:hypothetical protein
MDDRVARLAGKQLDRVSRAQLAALGMNDDAVDLRVSARRLEIVQYGVLAVAPVLAHDEWGRFTEAVLTDPQSLLNLASAAAAWGFWDRSRDFETIVRSGNGGPRRTGGVLVGGPFHLDVGEDARKEACWAAAGWTVRRLDSELVHTHPDRLLALCPRPNFPRSGP